jgi:hypothetical protein
MNLNTRSVLLTAVFAVGAAGLAVGAEKEDEGGGGPVAPAVTAKDWSVAVPGWKPLAAGEHPRLIFRKDDVPLLRKRAETPAGKIIIQQTKDLVEKPLTVWHAAGAAFLYQVTGEKTWAEKAKEFAERTIAGELLAGDNRYKWPGDGQLRAGPTMSGIALAYDMAYDAWDEATRTKVAQAIVGNKHLAEIANRPRHVPGCNHWGAHTGGAGIVLLGLRGDPGVDQKMIEDLFGKVLNNARREIAEGYGSRGYYYEGHHCGRLSSNTGLVPFIQAYRVAAGRDLVANSPNAQWLLTKWVYEFVDHPAGKGGGAYTYNSRGMYAREFIREGASQGGDFSQGFGICPKEHQPAVLWLYNHIIEPGTKTYDVIVPYPHRGAYALANWPIDVAEKNPAEIFPLAYLEEGPGYCVFRNGWADKGNMVVTALMGSSPKAGRGMAAGGSVMIAGHGIKYTFPGMFHTSKATYSKFYKDGSGVVSATVLPEADHKTPPQLAALPKTPTSLAVDFSGASGAPLLVAQVGPQVGHAVGYWMTISKLNLATAMKEASGVDGYATKTTVVATDPVNPWAIVTLQKGEAPTVKVDGNKVTVGGQTLVFDGEKIVLGVTR